MLDELDLEDRRSEEEPIGECEYCKGEVMQYDDYYDFEGRLIHEECGFNFFEKCRKIR